MKFKVGDVIDRDDMNTLEGTVINIIDGQYKIKRTNSWHIASRSTFLVDDRYHLVKDANIFGKKCKAY